MVRTYSHIKWRKIQLNVVELFALLSIRSISIHKQIQCSTKRTFHSMQPPAATRIITKDGLTQQVLGDSELPLQAWFKALPALLTLLTFFGCCLPHALLPEYKQNPWMSQNISIPSMQHSTTAIPNKCRLKAYERNTQRSRSLLLSAACTLLPTRWLGEMKPSDN